jgi:hypothetical protein
VDLPEAWAVVGLEVMGWEENLVAGWVVVALEMMGWGVGSQKG